MDDAIIQKLILLNLQFYQSFAASFSSTRYAVQPGVKLAAAQYLAEDHRPLHSVLDIGCGNGGLARYLSKTTFTGSYTGLDSAAELLEYIRPLPSNLNFSANFQQADITLPGWDGGFINSSFDRIVSFAVIHHIPSAGLRQLIFQSLHRLLSPGGYFIHSCWQFMNEPRLLTRIIPWSDVGLDKEQVEAGDYLLDWRAEQGVTGYRYVHLFNETELRREASSSGFKVVDSYLIDGRKGNLALYQVWQPVN